MATNSGRGNPIGADEGPSKATSAAPPPVTGEVKDAVKGAAGQADGAGLHASGQDAGAAPPAGNAEPKVKTEKECMSFSLK
jgi:valyl-tRNA synthetase